MDVVCYKDILFYKGKFYTNKENIKSVFLHNRNRSIHDTTMKFSPLDIKTINIPETPKTFDKGILLIECFHWNPAHLMWDFIYPSWYGLFYNYPEHAKNNDFQWISSYDLTGTKGLKYIDILETFSGNPIYSLNSFSTKYDKPLIIPWLITGLKSIGIGCINKNNLHVQRGLEVNNIDPVEVFINRWYSRYNIKRNTLINNSNNNSINNIIYIKNKRPYQGIEDLFKKLNEKYSDKYNFKIIDYKNYNLKQQLELLNTSCLCVVGVGSARANTPFLPNGAIEIQTNVHSNSNKNFIEYVDYHLGTLSKYVKVTNILHYTQEEVKRCLCSKYLEEFIDKELKQIPCMIPVNLDENIPLEIRLLKQHKNFDEMFDNWRNILVNDVGVLFKLLKK